MYDALGHALRHNGHDFVVVCGFPQYCEMQCMQNPCPQESKMGYTLRCMHTGQVSSAGGSLNVDADGGDDDGDGSGCVVVATAFSGADDVGRDDVMTAHAYARTRAGGEGLAFESWIWPPQVRATEHAASNAGHKLERVPTKGFDPVVRTGRPQSLRRPFDEGDALREEVFHEISVSRLLAKSVAVDIACFFCVDSASAS